VKYKIEKKQELGAEHCCCVGKVVLGWLYISDFKMFWKLAVRWKEHQELTGKVTLYNLNRESHFGITKLFPTVIKKCNAQIFYVESVLYNDGKTGLMGMMEEIGTHIVTWCGEEFDGAKLRTNSMFGLSPSAIDLTHKDALVSSVLKLYGAIRNCSPMQLERYFEMIYNQHFITEERNGVRLIFLFDIFDSSWFKHSNPHPIEIKGWELQLMFASINDFSKDVVNAIGRMSHKMDDDLFAEFKEKRFRHFLPPEFVVSKNNMPCKIS
jgi:hypothetical protein